MVVKAKRMTKRLVGRRKAEKEDFKKLKVNGRLRVEESRCSQLVEHRLLMNVEVKILKLAEAAKLGLEIEIAKEMRGETKKHIA